MDDKPEDDDPMEEWEQRFWSPYNATDAEERRYWIGITAIFATLMIVEAVVFWWWGL